DAVEQVPDAREAEHHGGEDDPAGPGGLARVPGGRGVVAPGLVILSRPHPVLPRRLPWLQLSAAWACGHRPDGMTAPPVRFTPTGRCSGRTRTRVSKGRKSLRKEC